MKKTLLIGTNDQGCRVWVFLKLDRGALSLTGVEDPSPNGNCHGSFGQINGNYRNGTACITRFIKPWSGKTWDRLLSIWDEWHLNDMFAYCEHLTKAEFLRPLMVPKYVAANKLAHLIAKARRDLPSAKILLHINKILDRNREGCRCRHPDLWDGPMRNLVACGYLRPGVPETRSAGHVYPTEHPEGLLMATCPVCGYRQGTDWLRRELPTDVVKFLENLEEAKTPCPWRS